MPRGHLTENLKVRIDEDTLRQLEQLAEKNDRSVGAEIRRAVRRHLVAELPLEFDALGEPVMDAS